MRFCARRSIFLFGCILGNPGRQWYFRMRLTIASFSLLVGIANIAEHLNNTNYYQLITGSLNLLLAGFIIWCDFQLDDTHDEPRTF